MRTPVLACVLILIASSGMAEPIRSSAIQVLDGDTISARGRTVRLVGFDSPEAGMNAMCEARTLAAQATAKLRHLVAGGGLDLTLVRCSLEAAKRFAANVLPVIRDIQAHGAVSQAAIAAKLNERRVPTALGGKWGHAQVAAVIARAG